MTTPNPFRGFRYPAEVIQHAVWLYHCFSLSLRDVELIFELKRRRPRPGDQWYLDEVFIRIRGKLHYFWRAIGAGALGSILIKPRTEQKIFS